MKERVEGEEQHLNYTDMMPAGGALKVSRSKNSAAASELQCSSLAAAWRPDPTVLMLPDRPTRWRSCQSPR